MEENLLKKIISGSTVTPPDDILKAFQKDFPEAKNIDWHIKDNIYEAIFYLEEMEHIARFDNIGRLLDTRKNLPIDRAPENVLKSASLKGEIMNVVAKITTGQEIQYEVIFRNIELKRFMLLLNEAGFIYKEKLL